jgi:pimeloyl-ACP methyl ester carboxylesterase
VLYSHGNAEDLGDLDRLMAPFTQLGLGVVAYDYQGYGTSEGTPTEAHLEDDILAAYRYVTETRGVAPSRVIVYGRSIGRGPSVWLASTHEVGALVLESARTPRSADDPRPTSRSSGIVAEPTPALNFLTSRLHVKFWAALQPKISFARLLRSRPFLLSTNFAMRGASTL